MPAHRIIARLRADIVADPWMTNTLDKLNHGLIDLGWRDPAASSLTDRAGGPFGRFTFGKTQESAGAAGYRQIMVIGETSDATFTQARQF